MFRLTRYFLVLLFCIGASGSGAFGSPLGGVGAATGPDPSHGWCVVESGEGFMVVHVPPRDGENPAEPGAIRSARQIQSRPDALISVGDRAYLLFRPIATEDSMLRRVLTLRSLPSGIEGLWASVPSAGLDPAPQLPGLGQFLGAAVHNGSPAVLMRNADGVQLLVHSDLDWDPIELPDAFDRASLVAWALIGLEDGVVIAARDEGGSYAYQLQEDGWTSRPMADWQLFWNASWRRGWADEVVVGVAEEAGEQEMGIWSVGAMHAARIATVRDRDNTAPVVLASSGSLLLVTEVEDAPPELVEISLATGRERFAGTAPSKPVVSPNEFRMIAGMLILVMCAALFVIIRPGTEQPVVLPEGWVLADPGRRLLASVGDLLLVMWLVAPIFNARPGELLSLVVLLRPDGAWLALPAVVVLGWLAMGVWEGLLGFTPGKLLVGIRVYRSAGGEPGKLGVFWALVRGAVKWLIPPVAAMALFDPMGRHRGDAAARAVVVIRHPVAESDDPGDSDPG